MEWVKAVKDRLPHGRGSRAARDGEQRVFNSLHPFHVRHYEYHT